ncbi:MAG: thioredoxin-dependent thiol peroxidase [Candidatus Hydrothermales bacterium]
MLKEGERAPYFKLMGIDERGEEREISIEEFRGRKVVLYFYPKDNTPGCTKEAISFRDNLVEIKKKGAVIVGISKDSIKSHKNFKNKYQLNFNLLSDPNCKIPEVYNVCVKKNRYGKTTKGIVRSTFIIDEEGIIRKVFYDVKVEGHVEEVLRYL